MLPKPAKSCQPNLTGSTKPRAMLSLLLSAFVYTSLCGCLFRRMTINSDPPGALVMLDGKEVGYTPYTGSFTYYGTREIRLIKPGYKTLTRLQSFPTPWYEYPGLDFFSENLSPFKITNRQTFNFSLEPQVIANNDDLLERAYNHRSMSQIGR